MGIPCTTELLPELGGTFADFMQIASTGRIYSGKTTFDDDETGWWLGNDSGTPKFIVGNASGSQQMSWDGSKLTVKGDIVVGANQYELSSDFTTSAGAGSSPTTDVIDTWALDVDGNAPITLVSNSELELDEPGAYLFIATFAVSYAFAVDNQISVFAEGKQSGGSYATLMQASQRETPTAANIVRTVSITTLFNATSANARVRFSVARSLPLGGGAITVGSGSLTKVQVVRLGTV